MSGVQLVVQGRAVMQCSQPPQPQWIGSLQLARLIGKVGLLRLPGTRQDVWLRDRSYGQIDLNLLNNTGTSPFPVLSFCITSFIVLLGYYSSLNGLHWLRE